MSHRDHLVHATDFFSGMVREQRTGAVRCRWSCRLERGLVGWREGLFVCSRVDEYQGDGEVVCSMDDREYKGPFVSSSHRDVSV